MTDPTTTHLQYARRHLQLGWWLLFVFASFGLTLELLHGFKVRAYLDVSNQTRRLMWTLGHAHGTLLGVVNILFGLMIAGSPDLDARRMRLISRALLAASFLLPGGFFLGGISFYSGDPGVGVLIVPIGAIWLLIALFFIARGCSIGRPLVNPRSQSRGPRARVDTP